MGRKYALLPRRQTLSPTELRGTPLLSSSCKDDSLHLQASMKRKQDGNLLQLHHHYPPLNSIIRTVLQAGRQAGRHFRDGDGDVVVKDRQDSVDRAGWLAFTAVPCLVLAMDVGGRSTAVNIDNTACCRLWNAKVIEADTGLDLLLNPPPPFVVPRPTGVEQTSRHTLRARKEKKKKRTKEPGESGESTVFGTDNGREHNRNKYKSNKTHGYIRMIPCKCA
ncbi:uncharacterized protein An18g06060 [Aspergillus niger]|uniref:Contig An18c0190, genomic contig n=2 Tax=Aspergillus niger TaxID=5061 RepID=A2RBA5_ASPNC|nr:uncharacterized protein An18g06060 [Aspergillus niger]CAK43329.1 unnamed protein product [Aspergillus niger]